MGQLQSVPMTRRRQCTVASDGHRQVKSGFCRGTRISYFKVRNRIDTEIFEHILALVRCKRASSWCFSVFLKKYSHCLTNHDSLRASVIIGGHRSKITQVFAVFIILLSPFIFTADKLPTPLTLGAEARPRSHRHLARAVPKHGHAE